MRIDHHADIEPMQKPQAQPLKAQPVDFKLSLPDHSSINMNLIPAGNFIMGDDEGYSYENPAHDVFLEAFYISKYLITNAECRLFVQDTDHPLPKWRDGVMPPALEKHPVVSISWHGAMTYCEWLSRVSGQLVRLPTEAEWEKAARGTDARKYPWGSEWDRTKCNTLESGIEAPTPIGFYSPRGDSPYGCVDMTGNVWEWTLSEWKSYPYQADDGRNNPDGDAARVVRGGSWDSGQRGARCASRLPAQHNHRFGDVGFRVVVSPHSHK